MEFAEAVRLVYDLANGMEVTSDGADPPDQEGRSVRQSRALDLICEWLSARSIGHGDDHRPPEPYVRHAKARPAPHARSGMIGHGSSSAVRLAIDRSSLRAFSIKQPWAWLIVNRFRDLENRNRRFSFRGRVLIHASKQVDRMAYARLTSFEPQADHRISPEFASMIGEIKRHMPPLEALDTGGIIGSAIVTDCVQGSPSAWFKGPFGLLLADAETLPFVPCPGQLGFFQPTLPGSCARGLSSM